MVSNVVKLHDELEDIVCDAMRDAEFATLIVEDEDGLRVFSTIKSPAEIVMQAERLKLTILTEAV